MLTSYELTEVKLSMLCVMFYEKVVIFFLCRTRPSKFRYNVRSHYHAPYNHVQSYLNPDLQIGFRN